jgi:dipeptidyl aminopeptidase/acylaminoacyl peptidase
MELMKADKPVSFSRFAVHTLALLALLAPFSAAAGFLQLISQPASSPAPATSGGGDSWAPMISPDGRYVLFACSAVNLAQMSNNASIPAVFPIPLNVFLRDRVAGTTALASVNLSGVAGGNANSMPCGLSTNGQYVLFQSDASDLVNGDTNKGTDIFRRDMQAGTTLLVSVATNGGVANGGSRDAVMTPDGRYVAFANLAPGASGNNLVVGDTNKIQDIFVRDLQLGQTTLVSVGATGQAGLVSSEAPCITPDGRFVAFYSTASNLVPNVPAGGDIYLRDVVGQTTTWASTNARAILQAVTGTNNAVSYNQCVSADGNFVAYETSSLTAAYPRPGIILRYNVQSGLTDIVATNAYVSITAGYEDIQNLSMTADGRFIAFIANTNGTPGTDTCINLWDGQSGGTILISGDVSNNIPVGSSNDCPTVDPTGRYVCFLSSTPNLTSNVVTSGYHVYVRDTLAGTTALADIGPAGPASLDTSPTMSTNGQIVAFTAGGHFPGSGRDHDWDVYARDLTVSNAELASVRAPGLFSITPDGPCHEVSLNANGRYAVFSSEADNLVTNDLNGLRHVFVRDLLTGTNILISQATNGYAANSSSLEPAISADGRLVVFTSLASDLSPGVTNNQQQIFLRDWQAGTTQLISVDTSGVNPGNGASSSPQISSGGSGVLFHSKAGNLAQGSLLNGDNVLFRDLKTATTYLLAGVSSPQQIASTMTADGHFIAFGVSGSGAGLFVWDSQAHTMVYTNSTNSIGAGPPIGISPDGNRLLCNATAQKLLAIDRSSNTVVTVGSIVLTWRSIPRFSGDSRFVVYSGQQPGSFPAVNQIYLYDFQTGTNQLLSISLNSGSLASSNSDSPDISANGRFVVYRSRATDLVAGVTNGQANVFIYDRLAGTTSLLTASVTGNGGGDNISIGPVFSGDGRTLALISWASNLAANDYNQWSDMFDFAFLYADIVPGPTPDIGPTISWPAVAGHTYTLQFEDSLTGLGSWQDVTGTVTIAGNRASITDTPSSGQRFYRIIAQ